ncbi:hypothetical protein [Streptomyces sp. NPDC093591]|uniref:hypothetical protein n=1 Tax=Streptomyces sp. NPDC093591 TaxID=3366044 RepID=UPI0037F2666B
MGAFQLKSVTTGKCLQWNGLNKAITLATCKEKYSQYWATYGTQIASLENNLGGYCFGTAKSMEKAPVGRACYQAPGLRGNDLRYNHKTYLASAGLGWPTCYIKVVSGKAKCGKRTSDLKYMKWVVMA